MVLNGAWTEPLSLRERGWGEGASNARSRRLAREMGIALRSNPHPPYGTPDRVEGKLLSRRERGSLRMFRREL
ncbi:hypothetical protein GCM10007901_39300 [Dyella acidisoli]|uniref:Uncharacterized protein n=1 Tax=Dyella acidisoli TaxID=1867834 RepID=A0ABQ5XUC7_9GAMM|nr:hypothetical protein GCM10007901_39300 [Dyella acidisoli]